MTIDNRINLQPPLVNFGDGTGQASDSYPSPGPARWDHQRSYLLGLLSNQSSFSEPIEFRVGTLFFDLNVNSFKYRAETPGPIITTEGNNFIDLANGIELETGLSLATWFQEVKTIISGFDPGVSSIFSKLTTAIADEIISSGSIVFVSSNRRVKLTDQNDPAESEPVGVTTTSANINEGVIVQHIGLVRMRMEPGLTLSAGDKVWMASQGRGSNAEPGTGNIRQVGIVFDNTGYVPSALDPTALVLFNLGGIDATSPAPVIVPPMEFIASGSIGAGAIVYLDGTGANKVSIADANTLNHCNTIVGVARNTVTVGQTVLVDTIGPLAVLSDGTPPIGAGSPIYLSLSTGKVTATQPLASGQVVVFLGYANTPTTGSFQTLTITWAPRIPVVIP